MRTRRWLLAAVSGAALVLVPGAAQSATAPTAALAQAAMATAAGPAGPGDSGTDGQGGKTPGAPQPSPSQSQSQGQSQSLCDPGQPPNAPQTTQFYDNNPLLGPLQLPTASPVGPLLAGYQRFGAQSENEWLKNYTFVAPGNVTKLFFPPENGYVPGPDGKAVKTRQTLLPGYRIDRFGFTGGTFLSPIGTPFNARSLAPQSLNTPPSPPATTPPAPLANYHTYCILKPFDVDSGAIAPWFAQPGLGTQFQLNQAYFPQATTPVTVQWLLDHKFIVEEYLDGTCADPQGWAVSSDAC